MLQVNLHDIGRVTPIWQDRRLERNCPHWGRLAPFADALAPLAPTSTQIIEGIRPTWVGRKGGVVRVEPEGLDVTSRICGGLIQGNTGAFERDTHHMPQLAGIMP